MRRGFATAVAIAAAMAMGSATAQETRPGGSPTGPGSPGPHRHSHEGHTHHDGHLMMCHHVPAGGGAPGRRTMGPGAMGPDMVRGLADLPADAKQAARVLRFRSDMLKAISEVLARHAAELEKGQ